MKNRIMHATNQFESMVIYGSVPAIMGNISHEIFGTVLFKDIFIGGTSFTNRETITGYGTIGMLRKV